MASQRFCLRWNNHQSNMLSVFDQLLHAETFTDVTLAVEGQLLKAHKMVLSACSPYFQALFVNHQEKHPIVILKDVPYSDMKSLLDFMYRGEVSVDQERLTAFLRVAESLRIKGLTEVNEEKCDIPALTNSLLQQQGQQSAPTPPPQLHRIHPYMQQQKRPAGGAPPSLLMPLLGNALLQPKRKRGRPRKLSGSCDALAAMCAAEPVAAAAEAAPAERLASPEPLEVKMDARGFEEEAASGDEGGEALLIDEDGDGPRSAATPTPSKDSESAGYSCVAYDEEDPQECVPIITLEVISRAESCDRAGPYSDAEDLKLEPQSEGEDNSEQADPLRSRADLLEYMSRRDGSVVCKLCGEILQSRTHWYRHKYKFHAMQTLSPAPLFQCEQCLVYFKSRKGYMGHVASRHGEGAPEPPQPPEVVITPVRAEREPPDPDGAPAPAGRAPAEAKRLARSARSSEPCARRSRSPEWEARRSREEKLVADIIDRVRRECEAAGPGGAARRGYTRRTTVMNT